MRVRNAAISDIDCIMRMQLRLFSKWDRIDPLEKINKRWFGSKKHKEFLRGKMNKDDCVFFVAVDSGNVIGYINCLILRREPFLTQNGYIAEAFVVDEFRKKGVGHKLLKKSIVWLLSKDIKYVTVSTHAEDIEANNAWQKMGFTDFNKTYKMILRT